MLTRRHIRVKVMQSIYAFSISQNDDIHKELKFINSSIDDMYDLYLLTLQTFVELHKHAKNHIEIAKKKYLATSEDKNPNQKFINNTVIHALIENERLATALEKRKLNNWDLDDEYIKILLEAMLKSDVYQNYMSSKTTSVEEDKKFVAQLFSEVIAPNEKLHEYIEDQKLTWLDDMPLVNTMILKTLKQFREGAKGLVKVNLYKDEDDKVFMKDLFTKTILNAEFLLEEIEGKTPNWDQDRIADIDLTLLKMAICELLKFPSIPTKVTINEYIELAKEYSTPKSSVFINGILDKLVKEYQQKNKLNKAGRGLI